MTLLRFPYVQSKANNPVVTEIKLRWKLVIISIRWTIEPSAGGMEAMQANQCGQGITNTER
jgi:hypothetical protein